MCFPYGTRTLQVQAMDEKDVEDIDGSCQHGVVLLLLHILLDISNMKDVMDKDSVYKWHNHNYLLNSKVITLLEIMLWYMLVTNYQFLAEFSLWGGLYGLK